MEYALLAVCVAAACAITVVAMKNWKGDRYLCDDCIFNNDRDCLKKERPKAVSCTVYRSATVHDYRM
jgi:hypothetical protein